MNSSRIPECEVWIPFSILKKGFVGTLVVIILVFLLPAVTSGSKEKEAFDLARSLEKKFRNSDALDVGTTLNEYLAYAALNNTDLKAAFYKWKSELEKIPEVSKLMDPRFTYGYFIESVETKVGPQNHKLSLKQIFPWFGVISTRKDIAFEAANAAYQRFQSEKLKTFYKVKTAYYDYYYLGQEIEITRVNMELLKQWESVARTKYRAALKKHYDVVKAQVELGKLEDRLQTLDEMKAPVAARLKEALNLPDSLILPIPQTIEEIESPTSFDDIKTDIISNNPDLKVAAHLIEKEEAAVKLAGKASYPDFTIGLDYISTGEAIDPTMEDSGKDPWIINVSINLPLWFGKNKAKRNQARSNLEMAKSTLKSAQNRLMTHAEKVLFEFQDAERKIDLYQHGLIPKAEQLLNTTYASYQTGEIDFLNVIDAQRQLLNFQLELESALVIRAKKKAELEMLVGEEL